MSINGSVYKIKKLNPRHNQVRNKNTSYIKSEVEYSTYQVAKFDKLRIDKIYKQQRK